MPTRVNTRRTAPRRRAEVSRKPGFAGRLAKGPVARSPIARSPVVKAPALDKTVKPATSGVNSYARALRFLNTLSDYERLRIVRYNNDTFNLDRMRLLLRKLGNPQDRYRSVHVA